MACKKKFSHEKLFGTGNTEESMGQLLGLFLIHLIVLLIESVYNYLVLIPSCFKRIIWFCFSCTYVLPLMQLVKRAEFWVKDLALSNM